jgi:hypothetical protein
LVFNSLALFTMLQCGRLVEHSLFGNKVEKL